MSRWDHAPEIANLAAVLGAGGVSLLLTRDKEALAEKHIVRTVLRLLLRFGRHVDDCEGPDSGNQLECRRSPVRPGGQPGDVCRLQVRSVHEVSGRAGRREHHVRVHAGKGSARRRSRPKPSVATPVGSVRAYPGSVTGNSCSCNTYSAE